MVKLDRKTWKSVYFEKLERYLGEFENCLVVGVDNVRSKQMQEIRMALRGRAELLMGKNTMIRRCIRNIITADPSKKYLEDLLAAVTGNIGFCFTNMDLVECRDILTANTVQAPAKAGIVAPLPVVIPAGPTGMGPEKTSFFQALNLPTKITKGQIEILNPIPLISVGEKVGLSEARLLNMLDISPFYYGLVVQKVMQGEDIFSPAVLDITKETLMAAFNEGARNVAVLSLGTEYPTAAAAPHLLMAGYKKVLAIAIETDYTFPEAETIKNILSDPEAFAKMQAAAAAASGGSGGDAPAETAPAPAEESSEEDEMEMGLFD